MKDTDKPFKPATLCVHAGGYRDGATGAIISDFQQALEARH